MGTSFSVDFEKHSNNNINDVYKLPLYGISTLPKASPGWEGLRGQMILRATPAEALATDRVTLAGQVEGDGPDERGYPGPPGWGLGVRLTTSPRTKTYLLWKLTIRLSEHNKTGWRQKTGVNEWRDRARDWETWRRIVMEAKAHPGL
jgi:hypothetical protein